MAYYPYYQLPYQQGYQPQQFTQYNQQQQTSGILWVGSEAEAQSYPVAPNNAVALWDSTKPIIYLKQADASGKPTMKVYAIEERAAGVATQGPAADYAMKSDLDAIQAAIAAVKTDIKSIRRELKKKEDDDE